MAYPSRRYTRSWMTQRLMNKAPPYTLARRSPTSFAQQLINPIGQQLQETARQMVSLRYDEAISTANINLLDSLYFLELTPGMEFQYTEIGTGEKAYTPPTVYATIGGTEVQLEQAENNDIETLAYDCLPSRIEDGEVSRAYTAIIPETEIQNLVSVTPESISIPGHLYVTIKNNYTWEQRAFGSVYFTKVYITGTTRKGTDETEVIPIRYNATFKTFKEWQSVESVFVSHIDPTATIAVESFPISRESYRDNLNIFVPAEGEERAQFLRLNQQVYGSTLACEAFTVGDMEEIRVTGVDEKEIYYELELQNQAGIPVTLNDFVIVNGTRFMYAVDNYNFYVYDMDLPAPNVKEFSESPDPLIDLYTDRWMAARNETVTVTTRSLTTIDPPYMFRWKLRDPDGVEYYIDLSGGLHPTTEDLWLDNTLWEEGNWRELSIDIVLAKNGEYIVSLEARHINEDTNESRTLTTSLLFFCPKIQPEIQMPLPSTLMNPEKIVIDANGEVWLLQYHTMHKLDVFHDYYLVDYERNKVWFKEDYSSARVVV